MEVDQNFWSWHALGPMSSSGFQQTDDENENVAFL